MSIGEQLAFLFILALPIASIAWTITHEDIFREPREWCKNRSENMRPPAETEVLLFIHLRILLQPLRDSPVSFHHAFQAAV